VAPKGAGKLAEPCLNYVVDLPSGRREGVLEVGALELLPLGADEEAQLILKPPRDWDVGAGPGQEMQKVVRGGVVGLVLDGRGRPIQFTHGEEEQLAQVAAWHRALNLYGG
jgi:hypothetical protein